MVAWTAWPGTTGMRPQRKRPVNRIYRRAVIYANMIRERCDRSTTNTSHATALQAGFQTSGRSARTCLSVLAAGRRRKTSHR